MRLVHWRCWDNQSSSLCDSDPEFRGIMTSWGLDRLSRRTGSISRESLSQRTAQSPFRSRVAMGGDGGVSDKEFLEVFVCKINRLGAREGCGRLFLLGGRVDLAGILRSDDCCRPPTL